MSNFLSQLTASARARLLEELNYLNLEEIRGFCSARGTGSGMSKDSSKPHDEVNRLGPRASSASADPGRP